MFLPRAYLEFPDASGCYGGENRTIKFCFREPDGTLTDEDFTDGVFGYLHELDLGPLQAIVTRQKVCSLCHLVATMFKESYEREISNLPAVLGDEGPCEVFLCQSDFGTMENRDQNLPYEFEDGEGWKIDRMDFLCSFKGKMENHVAFLAAPTSISPSEPTLLARYRSARRDITLFNSWLQIVPPVTHNAAESQVMPQCLCD